MTYPTYQNLIGGQWVAAATGKTMLNLNPADHSDVIGAFPSSHAEDVAAAVAAAKQAFNHLAPGSRAQAGRDPSSRARHPRPKRRKNLHET